MKGKGGEKLIEIGEDIQEIKEYYRLYNVPPPS